MRGGTFMSMTAWRHFRTCLRDKVKEYFFFLPAAHVCLGLTLTTYNFSSLLLTHISCWNVLILLNQEHA